MIYVYLPTSGWYLVGQSYLFIRFSRCFCYISHREWAIYGTSFISLGFPEGALRLPPTFQRNAGTDLRRRRVDCPSSLPPWASWFGRSPLDQNLGRFHIWAVIHFNPVGVGWNPTQFYRDYHRARYSKDRSLWNNLVLMEMEMEKVNQKNLPRVWWWFIMAKFVGKNTWKKTNPWPPMMTGILGVVIYTPNSINFEKGQLRKRVIKMLSVHASSVFSATVWVKKDVTTRLSPSTSNDVVLAVCFRFEHPK